MNWFKARRGHFLDKIEHCQFGDRIGVGFHIVKVIFREKGRMLEDSAHRATSEQEKRSDRLMDALKENKTIGHEGKSYEQ